MTYELTDEENAYIDICPDCLVDIYSHNDYHHAERQVCSRTPHEARRLAIETIVSAAITAERKRVEDQFDCSATVSWGRCGLVEWRES